ncbi:stage II sporulation protein M [Lentisphaera marina]|uniref:stage II sporulation protein M n=1 Tax=Lentisphaera marina TaxID=1111041 RepID=UPI002365A0F5|nr:stage II sporulation protein M [Lentisphaera marina]MDD7985621.1 stage II sporulation protein M [Lentisphaera marina]
MKQRVFEDKNRDFWKLLEDLFKKKIKRDDELNDNFPAMYRSLCRQLAVARGRNYSPILIQYLEELVASGHQRLYGRRGGAEMKIIRYFQRDFPRMVRKEWKLILFSHVLFYLPLVSIALLIQYYPDLAHMLLPSEMLSQMEESYDPANGHFEEVRPASQDFMMWGYYILNNVGIDFRCFAGGLFAGVGSIFFMIYNGVAIGGVAGHITHVGYGETFWPFVCGHSAPELTAAVFSGACGMKLGFSFIMPGLKSRLQSLKDCAADAMTLLWGTAFMTFLAAFIEAFWSSSPLIPVNVKYWVAACMWLGMILYFLFMGRRRGSE